MSDLHLVEPSDLFDKICLSRSCHAHDCNKDGSLGKAWKGYFQFLGPELAEATMLGRRGGLTELNHD